LAAASLVRRDSDAGIEILTRRQSAVVAVRGTGRVGAPLTSLLAAAGVGSLLTQDEVLTQPGDISPGGLSADDVGARRQDGAARGARAAAASVRIGLPRGCAEPDLAVLTATEFLAAGVADDLLRRGVPHLFATVREGTGIVGPLVLPGESSCARCHDLYRAERDRAWPSMAAQLTTGGTARVAPCDVVLATAVAAHTALQVLAYIDGDAAPPAVDGTIEIAQHDGTVRRRSWQAHPLCGCRWSRDEAPA
ncbi:MAG: ThiF family adenylyltransferase, partial [Actinomycetota bacterium]|nr:ThiF family adenylyltransferase [Actinomycetota bacterium]